MCHMIEGKNCFWNCRPGLLGYLIGTKLFKQKSDGEIYPYWMSMRYTIKKTNPYIGFRIVGGKRKQQAVLSVPTLDGLLTKKRINISAGFHISPIELIDSSIMRYSDSIKIYVAFKKESILFYDGENVSVSDFLIAKPDLLFKQIESMANCFSKCELDHKFLADSELWEKRKSQYRRVYWKLENWYKERRRK